ncbi:MAG TPA: RNA polymerase sigma factor [Chryseosolibacter sp.]|nr:RNA polymerase sigma factor [Chryseosolibacter sp.]
MEALKIRDYKTSSLEDEVIVRRIISGEKELFEILLRRYNQTLYRVIRGYLKNPDEVQDAMQNAYLKAYDKLFQFHGDAAFSTWLIRIGINEALARLKHLKKEKTIYLDAALESGTAIINQIPDKLMNPEKAIIRQEARHLLEQAIDDLPEKYRVIYILKEIEGLQSSQIEESLGISESNIKVRLHRAKKLLKDGLYQLTSNGHVFEFGNIHCDAVVNFVMRRILNPVRLDPASDSKS